eukprot:6208913-Pleurochrysis_carterae.AAC.6
MKRHRQPDPLVTKYLYLAKAIRYGEVEESRTCSMLDASRLHRFAAKVASMNQALRAHKNVNEWIQRIIHWIQRIIHRQCGMTKPL